MHSFSTFTYLFSKDFTWKKLDWTIQLLLLFFLFDFLIILFHLFLGNVTTFFHLDFENNLPTMYQSAKLASVGYLVLFGIVKNWSKATCIEKWILTPMAGLFLFLSADELGQIHENTDHFIREINPAFADSILEFAVNIGYVSSTWILYYIPLFILVGVYGLFVLWYLIRKKPQYISILLLFGFFIFLVLLFEIVSNQGYMASTLYDWYAMVEESAEMVGMSIAAYIAISLKRDIIG